MKVSIHRGRRALLQVWTRLRGSSATRSYAADEPPTFVVVGEQDGIAPPSAMERRIAALRQAGTEVEYHTYPNLGHGFGLGTGTSAEGWIDDAIQFWAKFTKMSH